jgi:hypothetical protein
MSPEYLVNFRNAFNPSGCIRIWGCIGEENWEEIMQKILDHQLYRKYGARVADEELFTFRNFNDKMAESLEDVLGREMEISRVRNNITIKIKFKWLKYYVCYGNIDIYSEYICNNANIKTYGGLIPTKSWIDRRTGLMSIGPTWKRHLEFYKNVLKFEVETGSGYGVFYPRKLQTTREPTFTTQTFSPARSKALILDGWMSLVSATLTKSPLKFYTSHIIRLETKS